MRVLAVIVLIGALFGAGCADSARDPGPVGDATTSTGTRASIAPTPTPAPFPIPDDFPRDGLTPQVAFNEKRDGAWVVGTGTVDRILRDDTKAPRHQRFVVRIVPGQTMLVAHNIDLAPRVPLKRGDLIAFRGEYVWNVQGGVLHWTHHDKRDRKAGGWIIWKGQNFR